MFFNEKILQNKNNFFINIDLILSIIKINYQA